MSELFDISLLREYNFDPTANMTSDSASAALKSKYLGRTLHEVSTPAAVLDLAKLEVNCQRMIDATKKLGLLWRPHIKTHKVNSAMPYVLRPWFCILRFAPLCPRLLLAIQPVPSFRLQVRPEVRTSPSKLFRWVMVMLV